MNPTLSLEQVAEAFSVWRCNRSGRCARTPDTLRQMALALTKQHPIGQIAKTLGLSGSSLSQWRKELENQGMEQAASFVPLTSQFAITSSLR